MTGTFEDMARVAARLEQRPVCAAARANTARLMVLPKSCDGRKLTDRTVQCRTLPTRHEARAEQGKTRRTTEPKTHRSKRKKRRRKHGRCDSRGEQVIHICKGSSSRHNCVSTRTHTTTIHSHLCPEVPPHRARTSHACDTSLSSSLHRPPYPHA